jgi:hypothetical protein
LRVDGERPASLIVVIPYVDKDIAVKEPGACHSTFTASNRPEKSGIWQIELLPHTAIKAGDITDVVGRRKSHDLIRSEKSSYFLSCFSD